MDDAGLFSWRKRFPFLSAPARHWASGVVALSAGCAQIGYPPAPLGPSSPARAGLDELNRAHQSLPLRTAREGGVCPGTPASAMADAASDQLPAIASVAPPGTAFKGPETGAAIIQASAAGPGEPVGQAAPAVALGEPVGTSVPAAAPDRLLPISLDTVLRLAEEQNAQVAQARARVREAYAERDAARKKWLPDLNVGTAYYRHEGGIQNEDGTFLHSSFGAMFAGLEVNSRLDIREVAFQQVNAQRKVWQQRGDLSRVTSETLLDATNTYIDLLTARTGQAISRELEEKLTDLLEQAQKLYSEERAARGEVRRIQAELDGQRATAVKLEHQAAAAAATLLYVLHLDPSAELVPVDGRLVPFELIDPTLPTGDLVAQALRTGPGIRELQGLLALIHESIARAKGPAQFLPVFEVRMLEGGFGAGPGDSLTWDNRWDLGVQARWNLSAVATKTDLQRAAQAKVQQAHLAYDDLRGKLTAGVQEARETSLGSRDEMQLSSAQIRNARDAYEFSALRRREDPRNTTFTEVLLAIGALSRAQMNYLNAVSAYDKAQLRLMVLLGPAACGPATGPH